MAKNMNKSIPEAVFETAKNYPNKTALCHKKDGIYYSISYQEMAEKIKGFAASLQLLGIKKEDKIAILSENRPEWAVSDLAIMTAGSVVVPIHSTLSSKTIQYIINHSEAKILLVSNNDLLNKAFINKDDFPYLEKVITFEKLSLEQKEKTEKEIIFFKDIIFKDDFEEIELNPEDICSIIYTSGTTGLPKGVMLSHSNFLSNAEAVNKAIPVKKGDVFLSFLPLSHILERLAGYYVPLIFGASIVYAESIKQLQNNLKEAKPTILICVPRIFERFHDAVWDKVNKSSIFQKKIFLWALKRKKGSLLYNLADALVFKKIRKQLGGRLRLAISGGASLDDHIERFFLKMGVLVLEGYGLTETSPVIAANREKDLRIKTVGKIIPGVEVQIDPESKEILVKGPNVMKGYYKNEGETEKAFDNKGWFHTGDLGYIDKDEFLTVIGRKKEMIVTSGGKNIWPETIENTLNSDKYITSSMIIGHKKKFVSALIFPDWQEIKTFLEKSNLSNQSPEKLCHEPIVIEKIKERIDKINDNLNDYEKIKKFTVIPNDFSQERDELTPTLKLRRHIVERHYLKEIESMYF